MGSKLDEICERKRAHIRAREAAAPLDAVIARAEDTPPPRGFLNALRNAPAPALIAEVKKASPSKGLIRDDFDPVAIAKIYEDAGAACVSVLTDTPYFMGHDDYLVAVRAAVSLPVLRKDFMLTPYQIHESRALGADCILLIMAALHDGEARDLMNLAHEWGMDVLVEVHDESELVRALPILKDTAGGVMIGVNNRDLKTLRVDLDTSRRLAALMPQDVYTVSESGITRPGDMHDMMACGYRGFLIGEHFMRQPDIAAPVKNMLTQNVN